MVLVAVSSLHAAHASNVKRHAGYWVYLVTALLPLDGHCQGFILIFKTTASIPTKVLVEGQRKYKNVLQTNTIESKRRDACYDRRAPLFV